MPRRNRRVGLGDIGRLGTVSLTARELTILNMISRGLSYAEIAQAGEVSVHTVSDRIMSIWRKRGHNSKSEGKDC